jgi:hypothetical protein
LPALSPNHSGNDLLLKVVGLTHVWVVMAYLREMGEKKMMEHASASVIACQKVL